MDTIGKYVIGIITAVILCGIFRSITENSSYTKIIRLVTGIIILLSIVKPIDSYSWKIINLRQMFLNDEADAAITEGMDAANQQMDAVISKKVCAYIEGKAASYGADVTATVVLKEHIPCKTTLSGKITPYAKIQLSAWIASELGISKEAQDWR